MVVLAGTDNSADLIQVNILELLYSIHV